MPSLSNLNSKEAAFLHHWHELLAFWLGVFLCSRCACLIGFSPRVLIGYTIDMDQDDSDEEQAIEALEASRDEDDSEELYACSE